MRLAVCVVPLLAACPYVPTGDIQILEGFAELSPDAVVAFEFYCDYLFDGRKRVSGGTDCDGFWAVGPEVCPEWGCEVEGGTSELGLIDSCGVYTAPATRPAEPIVIFASECGINCADACGASFTPSLDGYALAAGPARSAAPL